MALRDEFEYITFRCAYCYHLNSARKKKPKLAESSSSASLAGQQPQAENDSQGAGQNGAETRERPPPRIRVCL